MPDIIDIVTADHQPIYRDGIKRLLEAEPGFRVVGEAGDAATTIDHVRRHQPAVLVLDLDMPGDAALDVLKRLASMTEEVRTVVLTSSDEKGRLVTALQLGARGVVLKGSPSALLIKGIRKVSENQYWIGRDEVGHVVDAMRRLAEEASAAERPAPFRLTRREMDIVAGVADGESNKGIAERLSIKEDTVKHHVSNVFDKLGVFSRLELAVFAINHRLVKDAEMSS